MSGRRMSGPMGSTSMERFEISQEVEVWSNKNEEWLPGQIQMVRRGVGRAGQDEYIVIGVPGYKFVKLLTSRIRVKAKAEPKKEEALETVNEDPPAEEVKAPQVERAFTDAEPETPTAPAEEAEEQPEEQPDEQPEEEPAAEEPVAEKPMPDGWTVEDGYEQAPEPVAEEQEPEPAAEEKEAEPVAEEKEPEPAAPRIEHSYSGGPYCEANYQGDWYDARIVAQNDDGTYNVAWAGEGTYSSNVEARRTKIEVHTFCRAKYQGLWYDARTIAANKDGTYNVSWVGEGTYSANVQAAPMPPVEAAPPAAEAVEAEPVPQVRSRPTRKQRLGGAGPAYEAQPPSPKEEEPQPPSPKEEEPQPPSPKEEEAQPPSPKEEEPPAEKPAEEAPKAEAPAEEKTAEEAPKEDAAGDEKPTEKGFADMVKDFFAGIDTDSSGKLSWAELNEAVRAGKLAECGIESSEELLKTYVNIDADQNGQVALDEFSTYLERKYQEHLDRQVVSPTVG